MDRQDEVVAFLSRPGVLDKSAAAPEILETHISRVFLAGPSAFKLKRAVRFPYLDFSTPELRRAAVEAEVETNRRTAPGLYRGVVAVVRAGDGSLRLGGDGEAVDWLVEMARFAQEALFDHMAQVSSNAGGRLDRRLMETLAASIARFHGEAQPVTGFGGASGLRTIIDGIADTFRRDDSGILDAGAAQSLVARIHRLAGRLAATLDRRAEEGRVRRCHGDLHLRNIVLLDGRPTLFDAIEFNPRLSNIDVLYDLAFLLMDLDHRGLKRLAGIVFNRYLDLTGDLSDLNDLGVLPLFMSVRAAIRAHVAVSSAAAVSSPGEAGRLGGEARAYLELAAAYLSPPQPQLVAVGGLSGSGKSTLARELAPYLGQAPGARVVRSDIIRKRLAGVELTQRLAEDGYSAEMTARTYGAVYQQAGAALAGGFWAVADAVFARPEQRRAIAAVARDAGVPFQGLWLESPPKVMERRIAARQIDDLGDPSDATADVLRRQLKYDPGKIEWIRLDTGGSGEETLDRGLKQLGLKQPGLKGSAGTRAAG